MEEQPRTYQWYEQQTQELQVEKGVEYRSSDISKLLTLIQSMEETMGRLNQQITEEHVIDELVDTQTRLLNSVDQLVQLCNPERLNYNQISSNILLSESQTVPISSWIWGVGMEPYRLHLVPTDGLVLQYLFAHYGFGQVLLWSALRKILWDDAERQTLIPFINNPDVVPELHSAEEGEPILEWVNPLLQNPMIPFHPTDVFLTTLSVPEQERLAPFYWEAANIVNKLSFPALGNEVLAPVQKWNLMTLQPEQPASWSIGGQVRTFLAPWDRNWMARANGIYEQGAVNPKPNFIGFGENEAGPLLSTFLEQCIQQGPETKSFARSVLYMTLFLLFELYMYGVVPSAPLLDWSYVEAARKEGDGGDVIFDAIRVRHWTADQTVWGNPTSSTQWAVMGLRMDSPEAWVAVAHNGFCPYFPSFAPIDFIYKDPSDTPKHIESATLLSKYLRAINKKLEELSDGEDFKKHQGRIWDNWMASWNVKSELWWTSIENLMRRLPGQVLATRDWVCVDRTFKSDALKKMEEQNENQRTNWTFEPQWRAYIDLRFDSA